MAIQNPLWPPFPVAPIDQRTQLLSQPWVLFIQALLNQGVSGATAVQTVTGSGNVTSSGGHDVVIGLGPSGVAPGTYGDSMHVGQFTVSSDGLLTFAQNVAISGGGSSTSQYMPVVVGGACVTLGDTLIAMAWEIPAS